MDDKLKEFPDDYYDIDEQIDKIIMQHRAEEINKSTFRVVEIKDNTIVFQSLEDERLYLEITWKSIASYKKYGR